LLVFLAVYAIGDPAEILIDPEVYSRKPARR
jgi:hypothetical protein